MTNLKALFPVVSTDFSWLVHVQSWKKPWQGLFLSCLACYEIIIAIIVINLNPFLFVIYKRVYNQTVRINVCETWRTWDIILCYWPGMNLRWPILPIWVFPVSPARKSSPNGNLYWPSLFGQGSWILASFFFRFFFYLDFILVHKNTQKNLGNIQLQCIWTSHLVNNAYILNSGLTFYC